jgi:phosphoenolpyruvate carboxykinase (GTP)
VLKWIFDRIDGKAKATKTAIGYLPNPDDIDTNGLDVDAKDLSTILSVDADGWKQALPQIQDHYAQFGTKLPAKLDQHLKDLAGALA